MNNTSTTSKFKRKRKDPGRRPPREEEEEETNNVGPEERLYEIRDIKAEKWQGNRLLYLIDWADDPVTGEAYDNTWEPAHNVTEAAIEDWEKEKQRRQALERLSQRSSVEVSSESDSQPIRPPNWRKRQQRSIVSGSDRGRVTKRARTSRNHDSASFYEEVSEEDWSLAGPLPRNKGEIVLEIRVDPGFDPREYIAITLSQSSQASQASQDITRPDSPAPDTGESASEPPQGKGKISQTTIPDSQEISDSLPTQSTVEPLLAQDTEIIEADIVTDLEPTTNSAGGDSGVIQSELEPEPVSSEASGPDIPSRQPDNSLPRITQQLVGQSLDSQNLSPKASLPKTSSGFLTQPEFNLTPFIQAKSLAAATEVDPDSVQESHENHASNQYSITTPNHLSHSPAPIDLPSNSQAAQIVAPLNSLPRQIRTQTQDILQSIESDVVPDTVLKSAPRLPVAQRPSPEFEEQEDNYDESFDDDGFFYLYSSQRSPLAMSFGDDDAPSFGDQLRQMSNSLLSEPVFPPSRDSRPPSLAPTTAQPQEQSVISPSSVLPGLDNEVQGVGQVNPSVVWHDAPPAGISLRTIDMAFDSTKPDQTSSSQDASLPVAQALGRDLGISFPPDDSTHNTQISHSHFATAHEEQPAFEQIPATIAPSELTNTTPSLLTLTGGDLHEHEGHLPGEDSGDHVDSLLPGPESSDQYHPESDSDHHHERAQGEYIVTLPMAANTRSEYLSRISGENEKTMVSFGKVFSESLTGVPSEELLAKMDRIFQQLLDLCDLPAWVHDVTALPTDAMWKHATGTNSKFSFVFEFLRAIKDLNTRVLILCRGGYTFQYLEALLSAPGFNYSILGQESARPDLDGLAVTLASADQGLSTLHGAVDIIISFDHVARTVDLSPVISAAVPPLVLFLVVTHSIEHIDMQLGPEPRGIERKNALNLAIGTAQELLESPKLSPEPHYVAEEFAKYVRHPDIDFAWEPSVVPEHVLDPWLSSQVNSQDQLLTGQGIIDALNSRKRRHEEDEVGTPKRARILGDSQHTPNVTPAQMSDLLKNTLSTFSVPGKSPSQVVELPVYQLESMAAKIAELESHIASQSTIEGQYRDLIKSLEGQVQSWEKSVQTIQPKYMQATRDRGIFEKENTAIKKQLEARDLEIATLKVQNQALQLKLDTPEQATAVAAEEELEKARAKIQSLETRIKRTEENMDYLRGQYQTATSEANKFEAERRELLARITELERKAGDNFLEVHRKNREMHEKERLRQITEKNERIRDLEREVDRAREDLRHLKNGRRETRQGSVPRSPRPGAMGGIMMSPRPPRGGVGHGQQQLQGGPGSRGTSPAPVTGAFYNNNNNNNTEGYSSSAPTGSGPVAGSNGSGAAGGGGGPPSMTIFSQPTGNGGRWDHLRE